MEMVSFNCPHCGDSLQAPSYMDGQTQQCPTCNGLVTLQVVSGKQVVQSVILGAGLGLLAAFLGIDD
jgi:hypothetical protein